MVPQNMVMDLNNVMYVLYIYIYIFFNLLSRTYIYITLFFWVHLEPKKQQNFLWSKVSRKDVGERMGSWAHNNSPPTLVEQYSVSSA